MFERFDLYGVKLSLLQAVREGRGPGQILLLRNFEKKISYYRILLFDSKFLKIGLVRVRDLIKNISIFQVGWLAPAPPLLL